MVIEPGTAIAAASALGLSPMAGKLVERVLGPAADELGEIVRAKVNSRRNKVIEKAAAGLNEAKVEPREVPLRLLAPIIEHASLEDDASLADKWAALLANAAAGNEGAEVTPLFTHILAMMSPLHAAFLDLIASPDKITKVMEQLAADTGIGPAATEIDSEVARFDVPLMINSLVTQGLLQKAGPERTPTGLRWSLTGPDRYEISPLGYAFLAACKMPVPNAHNEAEPP